MKHVFLTLSFFSCAFLTAASQKQVQAPIATLQHLCIRLIIAGQDTDLEKKVAAIPGYILVANRDEVIKVIEHSLEDFFLKIKLAGHEQVSHHSIDRAAFSPNGSIIILGLKNKTACLWNTRTGELIRTLSGHSDSIIAVALTSDNTRAFTGSYDGIRVWDIETGEALLTAEYHDRIGARIGIMAFNTNKNIAIRAGYELDPAVYVIDIQTNKTIHKLTGNTSFINAMAFNNDGSKIITGGVDCRACISDTRSGALLRTLQGHTAQIKAVAFESNGNRAITGSWDKTARIWNAVSGEALHILRGHNGEVNAVAFDSEGKRAITGSYDKNVFIWDTQTGEPIHVINGHNASITSTFFHPNGNFVFIGESYGSGAYIWPIVPSFKDETDASTLAFLLTAAPYWKKKEPYPCNRNDSRYRALIKKFSILNDERLLKDISRIKTQNSSSSSSSSSSTSSSSSAPAAKKFRRN